MVRIFCPMFAALALLSASAVQAAKIEPGADGVGNDGRPVAVLALSGPITQGDADQLRRVIGANRETARITLEGTGGDFNEGWRLAEAFRELGIATVVEQGRACAAACAVAFLGGTAKDAEGKPVVARSVMPGGRLAFQAPARGFADATYPREAVERGMRDAVGVVTDFTARAKTFGIELDDALDLVAAQPPSFVTIRTIGGYVRYGIGAPPLPPPSRMTRSMAVHLCANEGRLDPASIFRQIAHATKIGMGESIIAFDVKNEAEGGRPKTLRRVVVPQIANGAVEFWCVIDFVPGSVPLEIRCRASIEAIGVKKALEEALNERVVSTEATCGKMPFPRDVVSGEEDGRSFYWLLDWKTPVAEAAAALRRLELEPEIPASFRADEAKR